MLCCLTGKLLAPPECETLWPVPRQDHLIDLRMKIQQKIDQVHIGLNA